MTLAKKEEASKFMKAILETRDLVKYYGKGDNLVKAIDHTDLIIEPGEFTAIVGRSGSGKVLFFICWEDWTVLIPERF